MTENHRRTKEVDCHVGCQIRTYRVLAGLSQEGLAYKLGLTFQQVQKYEKGVNRISAGRLYELSQIFGVPVSAFYAGLAPCDPDQDATFPQIKSRTDGDLLREILAAPEDHRRMLLDIARSFAASRQSPEPAAA